MPFCSIMCFSSSIICLLIVTSHGSVVPDHDSDENEGSRATRMNGTEHQRNNQSSSDMKNILISSHPKTLHKDIIFHNYPTYHISSAGISNSSHMLRKQRSAEVAEHSNKVPSHVSENSPAVPSQQPAHEESFSSISEKSKDTSFHNHQNHSHDDSETGGHQTPESQVGLPESSLNEKNLRNNNNHDGHDHKHEEHDHKHDGHDHDEHNHNHDGHNHDHGGHVHEHNGHNHKPGEHDYDEYDHDYDHVHSEESEHHEHKGSSHKHLQPSPKSTRHISASVWLYASVAVIIISLCGLLSVAVIPIMQKWFYHALLQFLVGLAVGSLSGDGLLHLMPHAILGGEESHDHNNHNHHSVSLESIEKTAIWRGLAALGGIFLFFIAERLLGAVTTYRRQAKEAKLSRHTKSMIPVMQREDGANNGNVGEKLAQPKKNSYDHIREKDEKETIQMLQTESTPSRKGSTQSTHEVGFHGRASFSLEPEMSVAYRPDSESSVIVSDHHGHSHGHSHEIPHSVSAVAWMVIMGDGLHNFCDGLAIGAAFASSDADGVSTTVAVFCHELPHELGDFAMLLKTGMKVKQALFYNGLSSILCFVGMVIGVCLGNVNSATNWVFAGTAGMFLYIALVDMLPELTSGNESGKAAISTLAIQVLGIAIGICVMLLIALYEHKLPAIVS